MSKVPISYGGSLMTRKNVTRIREEEKSKKRIDFARIVYIYQSLHISRSS